MPDASATIVVLAKAPVAGRVKTRLHAAFSPEEAASLARAALLDTLAAAREVPGARVVLALDGTLSFPVDVDDVVPQRGGSLGERIEAALCDSRVAGLPSLLIGMDTPQVNAPLLARCLAELALVDAVLGRATDGGWWALGLHEVRPALLQGVPMSTDRTCEDTERQLRAVGYRRILRVAALVDVDTPADAELVARLAPSSRFGRLHATLVARPLAGARA